MSTLPSRKQKSQRNRRSKKQALSLHEFHNLSECKEIEKSTNQNLSDGNSLREQMDRLRIENAENKQAQATQRVVASLDEVPSLDLKVSTMCRLIGLSAMRSMNGKLVRIIGPFSDAEQRYPVFVYASKEVVLIRPRNLQRAQSVQQMLHFSASKAHKNMASQFAQRLMRSNCNALDTKLMRDVNAVMAGNCVYIPSLLCAAADLSLYELLQTDLARNCLVDWSQHLKVEDPDFSTTFNEIVAALALYFDVEVFASRMNCYRDGNDWKPYHHDSHAFCSKKQRTEDFTIGISFGAQRTLSFKHEATDERIDIPQRNGDCFAFNSLVNSKFVHGVLKEPKCKERRVSIIVWGRRRTLNVKNSGGDERDKRLQNGGNVFKGRRII